MAHKVGDTVTVTRGPHKGDAHKVIHVHKDGRVNVKPHKKMPHQIKYRHGAATAKASEVRKMNEDKDHVSSNHAMHSHENEAQKKAHAAHMKKKHGVKTTYHGNDEVRYHGPKKNVKKALGNHYGGDHDHAKEEHPHIYKEGTIITKPGFKMTDNDKEKLQKIQKMLKRDKAVAKKSTHPGPNEDEDKPIHIVRSKKGTAQLHRISRNDNKIIRKEDVDEACWDTHKQVGMKKKGGKMVPNCVPKNENQKAALMKKLAKSAQSSEKGKKAVTLKKAPFRIPSKDDMKNEGAMKRIATSQSSKPDRMAGKGLDTFKKKPPEKNEVLDKDKDHMSYRQKAKYSMDRARNSATAKIVRGKGDDIDKEKNTLRKRSAGMAMSDRKGVRQFRKFHGYDKKK